MIDREHPLAIQGLEQLWIRESMSLIDELVGGRMNLGGNDDYPDVKGTEIWEAEAHGDRQQETSLEERRLKAGGSEDSLPHK